MTDAVEAPASSPGRRLLTSVAAVSIVTLIAKGIAGLRDIVIARTFGIGADVDAYMLAFAVISIAIGVLTSAVSSSVVPAVVQTSERDGEQAARRLFTNVVTVLLLIGVALSAVLALLSGPLVAIIGSGSDPATRQLAQQLLFVLLPIVLVGAFAATAASGLLARRLYVRSAAAQIANPLLVLVVLVLGGSTHGVTGLAIATTAAFTVEAVVLAIMLHRSGSPVLPRWHGYDGRTRAVVRQFLPVVLAVLIGNLNLLVDQAFASPLGAGSISALGYGSRITMLMLSVGAGSLGTVALPHYSQMVSRRDWSGVRRGLRRETLVVLAVTVPITVAIVVLSRPLVQVVFGSGAFTEDDVDLVARVQVGFALQIPAYTLVIFYARVLNALRRNQLLLVVTGIALGLNALGDLVLRGPLGLPGIAYATSVVLIAECVTLIVILARLLGRPDRLADLDIGDGPGIDPGAGGSPVVP